MNFKSPSFSRVLVSEASDAMRLAALRHLAWYHHETGHRWKADYWKSRAGSAKEGTLP